MISMGIATKLALMRGIGGMPWRAVEGFTDLGIMKLAQGVRTAKHGDK